MTGTAGEPDLERLRAEIALRRDALREHRRRLEALEGEIAAFARQYDRALGRLQAQLDALQEQIEQQRGESITHGGSGSSMWGPYRSFEESFDARYRRPLQDTHGPNAARKGMQNTPRLDDGALRMLYRKLVRQFHPDTTLDPAQKARYTVIMAQVNAAYQARNAEALLELDGRPNLPPPDVSTLDRIETLHDLMATLHRLDAEISDAQIAYQALMRSPLMQLKIEYSLARAQGRNLLLEIASRLQQEIAQLKGQLR